MEDLKYEIQIRKGTVHSIVCGKEVITANAGAFNLTITDNSGEPFDISDWGPRSVLKHASVAAQSHFPEGAVVCAKPVDLENGLVEVYVRRKTNIDRMRDAVREAES